MYFVIAQVKVDTNKQLKIQKSIVVADFVLEKPISYKSEPPYSTIIF